MVTRYNNTNEGIADTVLNAVVSGGSKAIKATKGAVQKMVAGDEYAAMQAARAKYDAVVNTNKVIIQNMKRSTKGKINKNYYLFKRSKERLVAAKDQLKAANDALNAKTDPINKAFASAEDKAAKMYNGTKTVLKTANKFVSDHPYITSTMAGVGVAAMRDSDDEKKKNQADENVKQVAGNIILEAIKNIR